MALAVTAQLPVGTVNDLLGSLSQVTVPVLETLTNLYENVVPAGILTVDDQRGLEEVYWSALSAGADDGFHDPN